MTFLARRRILAWGLVLSITALLACKPAAPPIGVDKRAVGTWELAVSPGRWLWRIDSNGTYDFHSEAADGVSPHSGRIAANGGAWTLQATNGYSDHGTFSFKSSDTLVVTGHLGTGPWHRLANVDNDANPLGTWELSVNGARWVWKMDLDGSYDFHSEPADAVPSHSGSFRAGHGYWWLQATNGYADGGTYTFHPPDTLIATGHLGTATWLRPATDQMPP